MKKWELLEKLMDEYKKVNMEKDNARANIRKDSKRLEALEKLNDKNYIPVIIDIKNDINHFTAVRDELETKLKNMSRKISQLKEETGLYL